MYAHFAIWLSTIVGISCSGFYCEIIICDVHTPLTKEAPGQALRVASG